MKGLKLHTWQKVGALLALFLIAIITPKDEFFIKTVQEDSQRNSEDVTTNIPEIKDSKIIKPFVDVFTKEKPNNELETKETPNNNVSQPQIQDVANDKTATPSSIPDQGIDQNEKQESSEQILSPPPTEIPAPTFTPHYSPLISPTPTSTPTNTPSATLEPIGGKEIESECPCGNASGLPPNKCPVIMCVR